MKKPLTDFYKELDVAYNLQLIVGYSVKEDPRPVLRLVSFHIIFDEKTKNSTIDALIQYIEMTYNIGVTNRGFYCKQLWLHYFMSEHECAKNASVHTSV